MKSFKLLLTVVLLAAVTTGAVIGLRAGYAHVAAAYWRSRVEAAAGRDTAEVLGQAAASGRPGLSVAVETLGARHERLAAAALEALRRRLDEWQEIPSESNLRRQTQLARALAEKAPAFAPLGRDRAARLAGRILLWLPPNLPGDRTAVIADCDRVLAVAKPGLGPPAALPDGGELTATKPGEPASDEPPSVFELAAAGDAGWTPEPWPPLPVTVPPEARVASQAHEERESSPCPVEPPAEEAGAAVAEDSGEGPLVAESLPPERPSEAAVSEAEGPAQPLPEETHREAVPIPVEDLRTLPTVEVMRKLHEPATRGAAARAELERRGFTAVHLALAERLFAPDAEVRAELVRLLPRLESADPDPWLWQLAQDAEATIRRAAIAALATSGDVSALDRLEQLARGDPDPEVRQQAARIARIREERLR